MASLTKKMEPTESAHLCMGAVVWVYLEGYPWWPAYVIGEDREVNTRLVEFFNDNHRVYRAPLCDIAEYNANMHLALQSGSNMRDVVSACQEANMYLKLSPNGIQTPSVLDILQSTSEPSSCTGKKRRAADLGLLFSPRVASVPRNVHADVQLALRNVQDEVIALRRAVGELRASIRGQYIRTGLSHVEKRAREAFMLGVGLVEQMGTDRKIQRRLVGETRKMHDELRVYQNDTLSMHKRLLQMHDDIRMERQELDRDALRMMCEAEAQFLGSEFTQITKEIGIDDVVDLPKSEELFATLPAQES